MTTIMKRRPLRVKLTILMVLLLSFGLLVSSILATTALRGYLLDRIDEVLIADSARFAYMSNLPPQGDVAPSGGPARPPSRFFLEIVSADGVAGVVLSTPDSATGATPDVPSAAELPLVAGAPFTAGSRTGGQQWRMKVTEMSTGGGWAVSAYPLADVEATVARLVLLQFLVGLAVVVVAGSIGYLLVRRSLKPLDDMAVTAGVIAAGDLSRRVPDDSSSTEVHELSTSFNTMVRRIEESFAAQRTSEAEARASEERMRRFVADAGHELRTPLTSIRGYAELIEQGAAPDAGEAVARIHAEATRMGALVDDLQLLARLDEQRPMREEPVDLEAVCAASVATAIVQEAERPITLEVVGAVSSVSGDEDRLRQVIDNLLSNAIRYSPPSSPVRVTIEGVPVDGRPWVRVSVEDEGAGVTAEEASLVFDRLYRTDEARTRVSGGSGLGLAIVASIVHAHGGEVSVRSSPGSGSVFSFEVPGLPDQPGR